SWRAHRLVYEEAPLAHLISDLNRYRDHPLRLTEARLANEKITATFDATDSDQAVATLIELYDLELEAGIDAVTLRPLREKM
ncbi:MAG: anti-sigma factor, partial [Pseudomonadota bacterium]